MLVFPYETFQISFVGAEVVVAGVSATAGIVLVNNISLVDELTLRATACMVKTLVLSFVGFSLAATTGTFMPTSQSMAVLSNFRQKNALHNHCTTVKTNAPIQPGVSEAMVTK